MKQPLEALNNLIKILTCALENIPSVLSWKQRYNISFSKDFFFFVC